MGGFLSAGPALVGLAEELAETALPSAQLTETLGLPLLNEMFENRVAVDLWRESHPVVEFHLDGLLAHFYIFFLVEILQVGVS